MKKVCTYASDRHVCDDCNGEPCDGKEYVPEVTLNVALCEGRHEIPEATDGAIFPAEVNPLDVKGLEHTALAFLASHHADKVNIYVTGLTAALIAAINAANRLGIYVTLYHFDRASGTYYPQEVE